MKKNKYFKEIKYISLIIGLVLIWVGIVILVSNNLNKNFPNKIIVNTSEKTGDIIENEKYKIHSIKKKYEEYSFRNRNINLKNQYVIMYPNKLEAKTISDADMIIGNEYISIKGICSQSKSFEEYQKKIISVYDNKKDSKYNVSISNDKNTINGYEINYLKIESVEKAIADDGTTKDFYSEKFIVLIKESDTSICEISYLVYEQKFTDKMLTDFINNIKIKENSSNFLYTTKTKDQITGTLLQKDIKNRKEEYSLSYKVSAEKYQEIENDANDVDFHTFEIKEKQLKINVSLKSILSTSSFIDNYINDIKQNITSKENCIIKEISYKTNIYNNKEYYEIDIVYLNNSNGISINSKYLLTKLEENIYYILKIESENTIDVNDIEELFNFNFK